MKDIKINIPSILFSKLIDLVGIENANLKKCPAGCHSFVFVETVNDVKVGYSISKSSNGICVTLLSVKNGETLKEVDTVYISCSEDLVLLSSFFEAWSDEVKTAQQATVIEELFC